MSRVPKERRAGTLTQIEAPEIFRGVEGEHSFWRTGSGCNVICGIEPARRAPAGIWIPPNALMLWHLSVSHKNRYPSYDEIADVRYALIPDDVTMAMLLPPQGQYVNLHDWCLHCWQIDDKRIIQ